MDEILKTYEDMVEFPSGITQLSFSVSSIVRNNTSVCIVQNRHIYRDFFPIYLQELVY